MCAGVKRRWMPRVGVPIGKSPWHSTRQHATCPNESRPADRRDCRGKTDAARCEAFLRLRRLPPTTSGWLDDHVTCRTSSESLVTAPLYSGEGFSALSLGIRTHGYGKCSERRIKISQASISHFHLLECEWLLYQRSWCDGSKTKSWTARVIVRVRVIINPFRMLTYFITGWKFCYGNLTAFVLSCNQIYEIIQFYYCAIERHHLLF